MDKAEMRIRQKERPVTFYFGSSPDGRSSPDGCNDLPRQRKSQNGALENISRNQVESLSGMTSRKRNSGAKYISQDQLESRCGMPDKLNRRDKVLDYLSRNESAMISCWNNLHGSTQDLNTSDSGSPTRFLRSLSFTTNSPSSEIQRSSSYMDQGRGGMQRSSSCIDQGREGMQRSSYIDSSPARMRMSPSFANNDSTSGYLRPSSCTSNIIDKSEQNCTFIRDDAHADNNSMRELKLHPAGSSGLKRSSVARTLHHSVSLGGSLRSLTEESVGSSNRKDKSVNESNRKGKRDTTSKAIPSVQSDGKFDLEQEIPEKVIAFQQSSYPFTRGKSLLRNEPKRHSMPLPVLCKKKMMDELVLSQDDTCDHVVDITDTVSMLGRVELCMFLFITRRNEVQVSK